MAAADKKREGLIGQGVRRLDADEKVRGLAQYADDIPIPDLWYGHVVRSPVPHGRLRQLTFDPSFDWDRVCVVTPEDIPGENIVHFMIKDMPFIAHDKIQYRGEPIALVAAPNKQLAIEAARHIHPTIEEHEPICTLREVVDLYKTDPSRLHEQWAQTIRKGDVEAGLAEADHVVEGAYWAGHQEQMYIEPQGMFALPEEDGSIFIQGSMQCPYYINPELCATLDLPPNRLRVKQAAVGGAFGGKEEFPTMLAGYCALLAMKCGKPVKIIYERNEDILYSTKRHPSWVRYKMGLQNDGTITAIHADFLLDGGGYATLSPVVLFRGILHAANGYRCENVFIDGHVYRTHTFPNGAFRGFGAPQALWALESHIDVLAETCRMNPDEFRLKNCLRLGDQTPTQQVLSESVGSPAVLEASLKRSDFSSKLKRCTYGSPDAETWYGIGLSFFPHGSGFTGDGEARMKSQVALDLETLKDGAPGIIVRVSSTEMGQGTCTIMPQIAADGLSINMDHVRCPLPDTKLVPNSGPTVASRTAMVVGNTVFGAAKKMKRELEAFASQEVFNKTRVVLEDDVFVPERGGAGKSFSEVASLYLKTKGPLRVYHQFKLAEHIKWNQETFVGDAYPSYSWGCNIAEVEIDPLTLEIHVTKITADYDIGKVINPTLAKGQIEGGLVQALGYSLMEKITIKDGLFDAANMQTYVIPTSVDIPKMDLSFVEFPYDFAEPGAKGVGEIPMDGLAPAVANAIVRATGIRMTDLPMTPEKLFALLHRGRGHAA